MSDPDTIGRAAAALHEARAAPGPLAPLPPDLAPADVAAGAAVQHALAALRGDLPPAGFKIGATGARMQAYLGLPGPAAGYIARIHPTEAVFDWNRLHRPGVECELAVRLGRDLPPGPCSRAAAAAAVDRLAAAIELVEDRYADIAALGTPTLIADQVYHHAAVIGPPVADWTALDPAALEGRILVEGVPRDRGLGAELLGDPIACLAWLAGSPVAAAFSGLRAGQWIMLGSVTPPVWLDGPAAIVVAFTHLPEVRLDVR
jgi:2-keto-4-pentenoate hydratase